MCHRKALQQTRKTRLQLHSQPTSHTKTPHENPINISTAEAYSFHRLSLHPSPQTKAASKATKLAFSTAVFCSTAGSTSGAKPATSASNVCLHWNQPHCRGKYNFARNAQVVYGTAVFYLFLSPSSSTLLPAAAFRPNSFRKKSVQRS